MTIPEALKEAASRGLKGLTMWKTPEGRYQASTTYDGQGWAVIIDDNPVTALERALGASAVSEMAPDTDIFG